MITANKGMVKLEGTPIVLEGELVSIISSLYRSLSEHFGEDFAKGRMEHVFNFAMEQEHEDSIPKALNGLLQGILEDVLSVLKKKEGKGEE